jgi:predicted MPP superfamily phosphohydrolase
MNRRKFIGYSALGAAALATGGEMLAEPHRLETTFHRVSLNPGASGQPVRVVQISDLHLNGFGSHEQRVARVANDTKPDLILITGDSLDHGGREHLLHEFMGALDREVPKLSIMGNWEYWSNLDVPGYARLYARYNCRLLVNESANLDFGSRRIRFVGIDDLVGGHPAFDTSFEDRTDVSAEVILAHCPAHREVLADHRSLMISGHTHGGQVTLFGWNPILPRGCGGYNRGWYQPGDGIAGPLYVSRGIGNSMVNLRMGSIPEVAVFEFLV